jgi:hypothetical protein
MKLFNKHFLWPPLTSSPFKWVYLLCNLFSNILNLRSSVKWKTKCLTHTKIKNTARFQPIFFLICIVGGGIKVHSTLRPLNCLLCQPRVIMIMEKSVE